MEIVSGLMGGFHQVFELSNLFWCFMGCFIGTLVGVLPGIGPVGAMSILLPATLGLPPATSIMMLAGIFYGAMYGGDRASILVNIPGEAASVITCLDGYQMAKKGRAGAALGMSAFGSFLGGTAAVVALMFLVFPLADAALKFGPPEFFALICLSLIALTFLSSGSFVKAMMMIFVGLVLGTIGIDQTSGVPRFCFGCSALLDGIGVVPVAMGLFGIAEVMAVILAPEETQVVDAKIQGVFPTWKDWKRCFAPITRGSVIGFLLGILPGAGVIMATFMSYTLEKKISKHPEEFGHGAIEGVAAPEAANNAGAGGAFVPLLALGIPPNITMGLLLGALIVHGITPGPLLLSQHPEIFWGVIASMYIGNVMLLILNVPFVGLWAKVLKVPSRILMPVILLCCLVGAYATNSNSADIIMMVIFGVVGYLLRKYKYDLAPLVLAMLLGPMLESNFRGSLIIGDGNFLIFLQRPISATVLVFAFLFLISPMFSVYRKAKVKVAG
ncbi:MAG: Tripartite tricarboxylate transporter TctA family protein [Syntrophorhabdus sp. PtaU1.Bin050]|jgi:putative tricarboxylic transport membrane protein|nr:MAG: Tripartite tricarboxylate transporter TctA family protein [Syntrophorhabdus sp. PtaU1.Bin050]